MTEGHDPQVIELADAIVEMYRRIYAFDLNLNRVSAEFWREQQAKGVSWKTYNAAKLLARPRVDALFQDYVRALPGSVMEALVGISTTAEASAGGLGRPPAGVNSRPCNAAAEPATSEATPSLEQTPNSALAVAGFRWLFVREHPVGLPIGHTKSISKSKPLAFKGGALGESPTRPICYCFV